MKNFAVKPILALLLGLALCTGASATDWYASDVVNSFRLGNPPYNDPAATLGKPSTWVNNSETLGEVDPCAVTLIYPAWNVGLNGEKLIATIKAKTSTLAAGYITVKFDTPIYDDPNNWHGKDFIVFGNAFFAASISDPNAADTAENMILTAYDGTSISIEPSLVSVSPDGKDGNWYTYENGPYADDYAPTHVFAWDWINNCWLKNSSGEEVELDFTRPVDPTWTESSFANKSCAQAIDMYEGSGGGTAFDLAESGFDWIQYIRVDGTGGEVDAFSRVSNAIESTTIGQAKKLDDGSHVVIDEVIVSAATYTVGRYCYVQQENRAGGIRVMGRVLDEGAKVKLCGDMDTIDGERVILATSVLAITDDENNGETVDVKPLGMPNKVISGSGLSTTGLLVKTWGKVKSVDADTKSFVIDDGSGCGINCIAPRSTDDSVEANWGTIADPDFTAPQQGAFVTVTGVCSTEDSGSTRVIRIRSLDDLQ
ncbi:MAG: hypothetical protein ABFD49_08560 [Armatimonadota bacterium]|nr:hypothetical protein [bacterium]